MISLKEHITEQLIIEAVHVEEDPTNGNIYHHHDINGHELKVSFQKSKVRPDHYNVGFTVNGALWRDTSEYKVHPNHAQQILQHVAASVHAFKQEHLPKSIGFRANEAEKEPLYHAFAKHLANRYRAKHTAIKPEHSWHIQHDINFRQGSRPFDDD